MGYGVLKFYDEGHVYELDGVAIPSVSEIMRFATREVYGDVNKYLLDAASERGTAVHEACEALDLTGTADIDSDYAPYLEAYAAFLRDEEPEWYSIERPLHFYGEFAGTIDRVGLLPQRKKVAILDIKTSSALKPALHGIQLAAYDFLWMARGDMSGQDAEYTYVLHLRKDGTYRLKEIPALRREWTACLQLHKLFSAKRRKPNGAKPSGES